MASQDSSAPRASPSAFARSSPKLTLEEKALLTVGRGFWATQPIEMMSEQDLAQAV